MHQWVFYSPFLIVQVLQFPQQLVTFLEQVKVWSEIKLHMSTSQIYIYIAKLIVTTYLAITYLPDVPKFHTFFKVRSMY